MHRRLSPLLLLIAATLLLSACATQPVLVPESPNDSFSTQPEGSIPSNQPAEFNPQADPVLGTVTLGGENKVWLDPTLVSMLSGVSQGPRIDASQLSEDCAGIIPVRPDVVLDWTRDDYVESLRIFFLSAGDPTMVVVTPNGDLLCSDDLNSLVLDPYIELQDPIEGKYAIFMGGYEENAVEPGFLVFSTQELSPANLDVARLLPQQSNRAAFGVPLPSRVLEAETAPQSRSAIAIIDAELTPFRQEMAGGGELPAFDIDLNNELCTGYVDAAPSFRFNWTGTSEDLILFFESEQDSTLVVMSPDGSFECSDDHEGADNLNPAVNLDPIPGIYSVWIGNYAPGIAADGTLTIATTPGLEPEVLTGEMITSQ
ncbi:MAG: hypothetical protein U9R25_04480 [Chloroflexota bacterium]|nr:hypothetical protein [Chloroflexota bacterium]